MKKIIIFFLTVTLVSVVVWFIMDMRAPEAVAPTPADTTVQQPSPQNNFIVVDFPKENDVVQSPLTLSGKVRGTWLFEASAPVVLTDWDGRIVGESYIEVSENWMTEDFVPFTGTLMFEEPEDIGDFSNTGSVIFRKANPSGLPQNDDALEYTVRFR